MERVYVPMIVHILREEASRSTRILCTRKVKVGRNMLI